MATHFFTPMLGKRIRVTKLDSCGTVPASAAVDAMVVTNGFISVTLSAEVEDGTEIITKKADGSLCVNERLASSFKRFNVEMEFCGVDPDLLSMTTNAKTYLQGTDKIGITVPEGKIDKQFALELWTGLSGKACAPGVTEQSGYLLLPFLQAGVMGDITVDSENAVSFTLTGAYSKGGNAWGAGPYKVIYNPPGTNEIQTITITGTPTGGTFTLTYSGQTTAAIAYNATAAAVDSALEALTNVGAGNLTVSGGPGPGTPYTVTFSGGALASANVAQMTATGSFTGGTTPAIAVTTPTSGAAGTLSGLPTALDPFDHLLLVDTAVAPPASASGAQPMP